MNSPVGVTRLEKRLRVAHRPRHDPFVVRVAPFLLAWMFGFEAFLASLREPRWLFSTLVLINYAASILTVLTAGIHLTRYFRAAPRKARVAAVWLAVFLTAYPLGLLLWSSASDFQLFRRTVVATTTTAAFVLIALVSGTRFPGLARKFRLVVVVVAVANLLFTLLRLAQTIGGFDRVGRSSGVFDQATFSGTLSAMGVLLLLWPPSGSYGRSSQGLVWPILLSLGCVASGSYLGLLLLVPVWFLAYRNRWIGRLVLRRLPLYAFLLILIVVSFILAAGSGLGRRLPVNYRVEAAMSSLSDLDSQPLVQASSFAARWQATLGGLRRLPSNLLVGGGMTGRVVMITYNKGKRCFTGPLAVHNSVLSTWLMTGALGGIPYAIFLFALARYLWAGIRKSAGPWWAGGAVCAIFLTVSSVTGALDSILFIVLLSFLCLVRLPCVGKLQTVQIPGQRGPSA